MSDRARRVRPDALLAAWPTVVLLVALLGAWELYVDLGGVSPLVLPAPSRIAEALVDDRGLLFSGLLVTAGEVVLGILVAVAAGLALAVAMHASTIVRRALYPLLVASQTVPIPILAPVLVLWLGFGIGPKLVVVGLVSFFSIVVTTLAGFASVDPDLPKLMATFGASRARTFRLVELPSALPSLFTGCRIAVTIAVLGAVFAEQAGADSGLGYVFTQSFQQLLMARAYAAVVILSAFAIVLFAAVGAAERIALPWADRAMSDRPRP